MPKMKTRRAAAKRFRVTSSGKVLYLPAGLRHNLEQKPGKKKRRLADPKPLAPAAARKARRLVGR